MPTYAYKCDLCNHEWDELSPMNERATKKLCPVCKGKQSNLDSLNKITQTSKDDSPEIPTGTLQISAATLIGVG